MEIYAKLAQVKDLAARVMKKHTILEERLRALEQSGFQQNAIEKIKMNGTTLPVSNKMVSFTVPTTTAELANDAGFIKRADARTVAQEEIAKSGYLRYKIVAELPSVETAEENIWYLLYNGDTGHFDIYALVAGEMCWLDDTTIDLSDYITTEKLKESQDAQDTKIGANATAIADEATRAKAAEAGKVDKVAGKGLSTNDFTDAEKEKLKNIAENANNYTLPAATANTLGGVKTGANITNQNGSISLSKENVVGALGYTPGNGDVPESVDWENVTGKPSTFPPSSHTHDDRYYTESEVDTKLNGKLGKNDKATSAAAADKATKLATVRTVSGGSDITLNFSYDGSANSNASIGFYHCAAIVCDTNNYPFHRFAKLDASTTAWADRSMTFLISQDYEGGGYGICRLVYRSNIDSSSATVSAQWLVRVGLAADCVQVALKADKTNGTYCDAFYRSYGTYLSVMIRSIASGFRYSQEHTWTLVDSSEANGTTADNKGNSSECWKTIAEAGTALHNQAYSSISSAVDSGYVNSAGTSSSCTGNAATATTASKIGTTTVGSATRPVYINAGTPTVCTPYPVGAIYISTSSTSPASLFGGTWAQIKDTFLLAAGSTYSAGSAGGEAAHTLATAEIPAHSHSGSTGSAGAHTHSGETSTSGEHTHHVGRVYDGDGSGSSVGGISDSYSQSSPKTSPAGTHSHSLATFSAGAHTHTVSIGNTGGGNAHNNMPPYLAVYVWKRTA